MQVLISCTNVTAITRMTETIKGKRLGANMGMSLIKLLSGYRKAGDAADANPHVPYIWDLDDIPKNPQAAIALLFDEDDANRSSTGSEKTDKLLFSFCPALQQKCEQILEDEEENLDEDEDGEDSSSSSNIEQEKEERALEKEERAFYKMFRMGMRAWSGRVYAYTATPITVLHDMDERASQVDAFIIVKPGRNYEGYKTGRSQDKWPWLKHHIVIEELPNRVRRETFAQKSMYPRVMRKYFSPDFQDDDVMPHFFRTSCNGTITLRKKDEDEEIQLRDPNNNNALMYQTAGWLKEKAKKAVLQTVLQSKVRMDQFWREDGVNLVKVLRAMHDKQELYPQGYRNLLYITNFSRGGKDQVKVAKMMLSLDGENEDSTRGNNLMDFIIKTREQRLRTSEQNLMLIFHGGYRETDSLRTKNADVYGSAFDEKINEFDCGVQLLHCLDEHDSYSALVTGNTLKKSVKAIEGTMKQAIEDVPLEVWSRKFVSVVMFNVRYVEMASRPSITSGGGNEFKISTTDSWKRFNDASSVLLAHSCGASQLPCGAEKMPEHEEWTGEVFVDFKPVLMYFFAGQRLRY